MNCVNYKQSAGIGALLNTEHKGKPLFHDTKKVVLAPARVAFLGLLRLNLWGISSLLKKQMFFVDQATTDASEMGQYYWDIYKRWDVGWYNLGGDMNSLVNAINAGANKKPLGIKLAPKNIRDKLKEKGISGIDAQGIGSVESVIVTAMLVIAPLIPLIMQVINNKKISASEKLAIEEAEKNRVEEAKRRIEAEKNRQFELDRIKAEAGSAGDGFSFTDADGKVTTAGYGIIGAGVLGMLFLGTMKKNKSKK
tara:strand:+ start:2469 stop:3224 length:756 start_codon:yes stop_codon:yes gene_type:complete